MWNIKVNILDLDYMLTKQNSAADGPEMEFLDINLTKKTSSLLLHAIYSLSTGRFLKKIRETRKLESVCEKHFVDRKK
jgi:hypothetical protein